MKKRFVCLLLSLVMVLLCFFGCAEDTREKVMADIGEEASKDAVTLSMYLMAEQPVSEQQELLMETKVNEITQKKFNIKLDLRYYTPDEYYTTLETHLQQMKEFYDGGAVGQIVDIPVYVGENGLPQVFYPSIEEFDVDIFYFSGYERYYTYKESGYLKDMTEQFNVSSKAWKAVINNTLLNSYYTANGTYHAVPTNRAIGEYTYILLNKDALDKTNNAAKDITSLTCDDCQDMLSIIAGNYREEFVPLYSATGELDVLGVQYFNINESGFLDDGFSILGGTYNPDWKAGVLDSFPDFMGIAGASDKGHKGFVDQVQILKSYEFNGYYATEQETESADKPFAVGYFKGGPEDIKQYLNDYEVVVLEKPTIKFDDLYESLFAVSEYTNSLSGSAEILTFLNTNEEFRNLILYGVEGENYTWVDSDILDETGKPYRVVSRQTKDPDKVYVMDALKTGNVALAYDAEGENPIVNAQIFDHNADLQPGLVSGFSFYTGLKTEAISAENFATLLNINALSAGYYERIMAAVNQEELDKVFSDMNKDLASAEMAKINSKDASSKTPVSYYYGWLKEKKLYVPPMGG